MSSVQQHLFGPTPDASQSQWFTPDWLAERVVNWAGTVPDMSSPTLRRDDWLLGKRVLELGAGDGSFVRPLLRAGAHVTAVERDTRFSERLMSVGTTGGNLRVEFGDALQPGAWAEESFDAYIGNPPYEDDADIAFIERGLELAPRVVAVVRLVFLAGVERYRRIWSKHELCRVAYLPSRPRFIGEKSGSAQTDFIAVDIRRARRLTFDMPVIEWWT